MVYAADATPIERAELAQLSRQVQSQVESLVNGQTVHGVSKAMLLNNVSQGDGARWSDPVGVGA
jgi:hypothetical protein